MTAISCETSQNGRIPADGKGANLSGRFELQNRPFPLREFCQVY